MIIENMAYDQQIQKQSTEKSNIVNPKTKLTNGRLELLQKSNPSSSQITPSPQTDEPSFTMSTGFRSSAPNAREWDEEEEQGPRVFYSGERRWGATHRKQMWKGWDTQTMHAAGINTTMVRSLHKRADGK